MQDSSAIIYTGYSVIIGLSLLGLYLDRLPFSLNKLFWIFCLIFFGIAPLAQYASGIYPFSWTQPGKDPSLLVETNRLIIACMLLFGGISRLFQRSYRSSSIQIPAYDLRPPFPALLALLLPAVVLQLIISQSWWLRPATEETSLFGNSSLHLLCDKGVKGIMAGVALMTVAAWKQKQFSLSQCLLIAVLLVWANFPTAIPRYWLASLYGGVAISLSFSFFLRRKRIFEVLMISGMLLIFPLLSLIRQPDASLSQLPYSLCSQDFDAYGSLRNTLKFTHDSGYQKGKQISTSLLFFIPRAYWHEKSLGSGALANPPRPGSDFRNYASPLLAEGYIDFGVAGALTWTAICAIFANGYDRKYWRGAHSGFVRLFYPGFLGLFFFLLRGDLLSSFAYSTGILSGAGFVYLILRKITSRGNKPS